MSEPSSVVLLSGGMDSTTAFYKTLAEGNVVQVLSFDYGQRHKIELEYAMRTAARNRISHSVIDIRSIGRFMHGSSLTDPTVEVPDGHYAEETMEVTIVPNRNTVMLSMAVAAAIGLGATEVVAAMHAGDHFIYPDCRPEFVTALNDLIEIATQTDVRVVTPFITIPKDGIVLWGENLDVDWTETWSCYKGGNIHCGRCGTCVERAEAFHIAGVSDPTEYEDTEFWRTVT